MRPAGTLLPLKHGEGKNAQSLLPAQHFAKTIALY
jgi:hypothetical protein